MLMLQMCCVRMSRGSCTKIKKKTNCVHQGTQKGSCAEPTCVAVNKRWGEEADGAIGESRTSLAADEGQSHGHRNQGLHRVDGDGG